MEELEELHNQFLIRWPIKNLPQMLLQDYVGLGNPDTFCQWLETKTRILGSIRGGTAIKFGIYKRVDPNIRPTKSQNDDAYSWIIGYGNNRNEAFDRIKREIIQTATLSQQGQFSLIDNITLPNMLKWKVAFLYSNDRLIPIYSKDVLFRIANYYGLQTNIHTRISVIQDLMMDHKPVNMNVYEFMYNLDGEFNQP